MNNSPTLGVELPPAIDDLPSLSGTGRIAYAFYGSQGNSERHRVLRLIRNGDLVATRTGRRGDFMVTKTSVLAYWQRIHDTPQIPRDPSGHRPG